jgi:hypothetical protein
MPLAIGVGIAVQLGGVAGEYVPPATVIDAPTEVTYIAETNPPSFNMVISEIGDGAVEVGDEPQKRYDGGGTIYTGDPIDAIPATQPLGGFGDSALPDPSTGYVQFRFRRDDGLGGYVYSDWSSSGEGAYTIGDLVDPVFTSPTTGNVDEGVTLSFNVTTDEATTKTIIGGAQAADFELVSGGTPATTHVLRWASNGTETPGAFEVQIEAEDASANTATQTITITCDAVTWSPADEAPGTFSQWLDGTDSGTFTMDGSTVTQWADKSGSGNHETSLTPGPGLASGGGVTFFNEGGNRTFSSALSASNDDEAVFMVVKTPSSLASPAAIMGSTGADNGREFRVNGGELSMVRHNVEEEAITSGLSLPTSTLMLIEMQLEFGAQTIMGRDGTLQTSTGLHDTAFTAGRTTFTGAKSPGQEPWGDGELKARITCPTKPDAILAAKIRNYLNTQWGL